MVVWHTLCKSRSAPRQSVCNVTKGATAPLVCSPRRGAPPDWQSQSSTALLIRKRNTCDSMLFMQRLNRDGTSADGYPPLMPGYFGKISPHDQPKHILQVGYYCLMDRETGQLSDGASSRLRDLMTDKNNSPRAVELRCDLP